MDDVVTTEPVDRARATPLAAADPVPAALPRVLIVDDNEINRRLLGAMLRGEGCALLTASDGAEALALARRAPPHLILLDIMMPDMDGYQVCAELARDPRTAHVPVVFLSALSETADKIKGLDLGAVDYITKPFDAGEVRARVRGQLKIQRLSEALRHANHDLRRQQALIDEDLKAAAAIQRCLVPAAAPPLAAVDVAWRFVPCQRVGGDLFNVVAVGPHHLAAYVFDVSGHGVPAAMVSVSLSQFLLPLASRVCADGDGTLQPMAPIEVLRRLDEEYPIARFDRYCTIAYAVLDLRTGELRYAVAGHPYPLILRRDGRIEPLEIGGPLIGLGCPALFEAGDARLAPGDRLVLYSDGIVEHGSGGDDLFGDARFGDVLRATRRLSPDHACARVLDALRAHAVDDDDDVTLLTIEYRGSRPAGRPDGPHEEDNAWN
jgi:sigma-B regulation protein RsbU (phosphoserine phosphatase)